jgi:hypothetical protein
MQAVFPWRSNVPLRKAQTDLLDGLVRLCVKCEVHEDVSEPCASDVESCSAAVGRERGERLGAREAQRVRRAPIAEPLQNLQQQRHHMADDMSLSGALSKTY